MSMRALFTPHPSRRRRLDLLRDALAERLLRHRQFICRLEVEPEHRAVAEEAGESQRRFGRNAALAVENVDDPPRGRAQRQRQRVGDTFRLSSSRRKIRPG